MAYSRLLSLEKALGVESYEHPEAPRGYYKRMKYLGKVVKDIGGVGLDRPEEFLDIIDAIIEDYRSKRISYNTARGRLLLLYRLADPKKNGKVRGWSRAQREYVRKRIRLAMSKL